MKTRIKKLGFSYSICMFLLTLGACILTTNLFAQDIKKEKVHFEKGSTRATIESSITGDEVVDYILNVQKGQYLNISMATDNTANYFNIMEPNEEYVAIFNGSINENMFESVLNKSGSYTIRIYLMRSAASRNEKANFKLEMIVRTLNNSSQDALVEGTDFNATGKIPCRMSDGQPSKNCYFGVKREGNGTAMVTITKLDGRTRTIFFENGNVTGYDKNQSDSGEFSSLKKADIYIIKIGDERYKIPEAVIFGG